ncbi:hypothetical protein SKAU_G00008730 [Synaphobranchus kaupii]|uniref:Uncharacterized protein n=1 Tax=Synaphobranchus kaupii TaxID=118154 RepID=A0A9Q1GAN5_SYNKA|nr:hypothetical protein SKAU_G00008730 [Synaphobranchus kaupii]
MVLATHRLYVFSLPPCVYSPHTGATQVHLNLSLGLVLVCELEDFTRDALPSRQHLYSAASAPISAERARLPARTRKCNTAAGCFSAWICTQLHDVPFVCLEYQGTAVKKRKEKTTEQTDTSQTSGSAQCRVHRRRPAFTMFQSRRWLTGEICILLVDLWDPGLSWHPADCFSDSLTVETERAAVNIWTEELIERNWPCGHLPLGESSTLIIRSLRRKQRDFLFA